MTLHEGETVADFESKVKESCPQLSKFKISSDKQTLGEVMKAKFTLQVNKNSFQVYPQFESLIEKEPVSAEVAKVVA